MKSGSLVTRLAIVIGVALLPVLAFQIYIEAGARDTRQRAVRDEATRLLLLVRSEQQRIIEGAEQVLSVIANAPAVREHSPEACKPLLINLLTEQTRYLYADVTTLDGTPFCTPGEPGKTLNAADRPYFQRAVKTGAFAVGEYAIGRFSGAPSLHIARPYRDNEGNIAGVAEVSLSLKWLNDEIAKVNLPDGSTLVIGDRNGVTLARSPGGMAFAGRPLSPDRRFLLQGSQIGTVQGFPAPDTGRRELVTYSPPGADPNGLLFVVSLDQEMIGAATDRADRAGLALIVAGAFLALALGSLFGRRLITTPVSQLLNTAERWRAGDLGARTVLRHGASEFTQLAAGFEAAATAVAAREHALSMALESTSDAVIVFDREWRCAYMNERAKAMHGRDFIGHIVWDAYPAAIGGLFYTAYHEAVRTGLPVKIEGYAAVVGRYLDVTAFPSDTGLTIFAHDVSEQHLLAASLRQREKLFLAAFEAAAVGIVVRRDDDDFTVAEVNEAFCRITHQTRDEVLAMKVGDVTHPDDVEAQNTAWRRLASGEADTVSYEKRYLLKDGTIRSVSVSASRIPATDGRADAFLTVVLDLTDLKRIEAALRESEARFRALADSTPTLAFSVLPDGRNEFLNQRWVDYTGLDAETGAGWGWADVVHPDDLDRNIAEWKTALASGNAFQIERRLRAADGSYRWFLTQALPIRDEAGRLTRWLGSSTDIQDIVNARDVMANSRAELEQLVQERTRSLQETQTHLAHLQRMEALGQLAGGIAHDFNNVLQAVQGGAGLIERRPNDPEGVRRLARMVFEAAGRGSSITRRLLAFARRGDLRSEAVSAVSLLTDMREILTHTLGAGIGVRVNARPDVPALLADKGQLETVLVNLAANARDAMAGNGLVTLGVELDVTGGDGKRPGLLGQLKPGPYICLSVTDTGAGMSPEVLARVTEPFFTTKERGQGTGLGLAMARGFAEQSGGGLGVESELGRGTTIRLWFPLASGSAAAVSDRITDDSSVTRQSARLIVVDDEPLVREIITEQLEAVGFSVLALPGGADALAALDAGEAADLMVSDLSMPEMDGIALIREAQRRRPKLPAILLTGFATNAAEIAISGAINGTFSLLRKPVTEQQLIERVAVLLEGATVQ